MENTFKIPRVIHIGGKNGIRKIDIGGSNPVTVQTMWKEPIIALDTKAVDSIAVRISALKSLGCDIVRFAVPDMESAHSLCAIASSTDVPLVADIHFDYRLALECLKGNVSVIRINPGNIGSIDRTRAVVEACMEKDVAIRIGVNSGSLPKDLQEKVLNSEITRSEALSEAALREAEVFDSLGFTNFAVSMKASSVQETIDANEAFARRSDIPLHIGVTEAGPLITGVVKSTMAFSHLLKEGIGSTIRVSLSSSPENEVIAGREILHECGLRKGGVTLVSCPRCGRQGFDVHSFMDRWQNRLLSLDRNITVAVMGCIVNGPGEGKNADVGIAGGGGKCIIFKKGKIVQTIDEKDADIEFEKILENL
ncbi:flavodoxin-dependent (E)-4-hydroxy-3-methylbut-2-enyl-diphosphate synthase [Treponema sp.]|uniref:flavodoxin-dependent (E)-4-hydroxy-3-methylbut-2-enyl-diphosphate synthase n=1 Tax=Treponema sp. TaxID=166 RepID=UPI003F115DC2